MNSLDHIRQLMSVIENHQQGVAEGSKGAVGKLVGESRVTKRLAEFSPTGSDDGDDDFNFSEDMLKRLAARWWQGDKEPVERLLMLHGWEIGQDEAHDDEPGVFVGQDGQAEFGWPVSELKQGVAEAVHSSESSHDDQHQKRRFPGFEDGGSNYVLHYEHESGAELELRFALSADGYRTVDDFLVDFQRNHPSAVVLDVEPESPDAAAPNNKLSEDHTMNDMRKLITVCESAMDHHNDEDQLTPGWGADDPAQRTINLDDQPGAHSLGEYYVDYDEDSGFYCVFHTDKGNGHAYASYTTEEEAQEACNKMNQVNERTDKGRRISTNEDHHSMAPHTEDSGRFVTKRVVGHEDREARMMQRELLKIADYAQELCDMLEHLQDADFPHWWQAKLVKAGDYMSTIKHFLDGEQRLGAREPLDHEISVMPIANDMLALDEDQDSDEDHAEMGPDGKPFDPTRLYTWGSMDSLQPDQDQVYDRAVDMYGQDRVRKARDHFTGRKQVDVFMNSYTDDRIADLRKRGQESWIPQSPEKAKYSGFDAYLGTDGKFYSLEGQGIPYEMPKDEW